MALPEFTAKFKDIAVTSAAPGFLTALSLVLLLNLLTGIPLLPFQRYDEILGRIKATKERIQMNQGRISALRNSRVSLEASKAELTAKKPEPKDAPALEREKKRLEMEVINATKEEAELVEKAIPNAEQELEQLETKLEEAGSLSHNMKELDTLSVAFISLIFSLIINWSAGQMLYIKYRTGFHHNLRTGRIYTADLDLMPYLMNETGTPPTDIAYFRARGGFDAAKQKAYDEAIKDLYRSLQVCMNLVLPAALLVLTLTLIVGLKIWDGEMVYWIVLVLVLVFGWGGVAVLVRVGYDCFIHYKLGIAHFIRGLWEEMHPPASAAPVPVAPLAPPTLPGQSSP